MEKFKIISAHILAFFASVFRSFLDDDGNMDVRYEDKKK